MTILDAENFGLAQLHHFGRAGCQRPRAGYLCSCYRRRGNISPRIDAFVSTTDGFVLAEQDLLLRGPGDILGSRQSGTPPLYLADLLRDGTVVAEARADAKTIFEADPALSDARFKG